MKTIVFLILAFLVAGVWWLESRFGAGSALCIGGIALGVVAFLIAGLSGSSSPPPPSVTRRVEITKAVYEERLDYGWLQNMPQIPAQNNYGRQPGAQLPTNWDVVMPPSASQRQMTVEHNAWPQIPLHPSGQHQQPEVEIPTNVDIARLIERLNRGK